MAWDVVIQACFYIFNNIDEVQSYLSAHKRLIKEKFPGWVKSGCW